MKDWRVFALASAGFAALTAILGKIGVARMNADLATFFRTIVILELAGGAGRQIERRVGGRVRGAVSGGTAELEVLGGATLITGGVLLMAL